MGNNPISIADFLGDTLSGVTQLSASRAQDLIRGSFGSGASADNMAALFSLAADGQTFNSIDLGDFLGALGGLDIDAAHLAVGYMQLVNDSERNLVEVVNRDESLSAGAQGLSSSYRTGADIDSGDGGGRYASSSNFAGGSPDGHYAVVVLDGRQSMMSQNFVSGKSTKPARGALLAHELLGHGQGSYAYPGTDGAMQAVQMENAYYRANGYNTRRRTHFGVSSMQGNRLSPYGLPSYFSPYNPKNLFR